jgi:hypothetical protein
MANNCLNCTHQPDWENFQFNDANASDWQKNKKHGKCKAPTDFDVKTIYYFPNDGGEHPEDKVGITSLFSDDGISEIGVDVECSKWEEVVAP